MGGGDENPLHKILLLRPHADLTASPPALALVKTDRVPLDVARMGNGDDHVLLDDQILDVDLLGAEYDFGSTLIPVTGPDLGQLLNDHVEDLLRVIENPLKLVNQGGDLGVFRVDFLPFKSGQPLEAHVENRLCLNIGQTEPAAQRGGGLLRAPGGLDHGDNLVDPVKGDDQPFEDMGALPGLGQIERRPPDDDLFAELQKTLENLLQIEYPRLSPVDRKHDDPEGGLHLGVFVELVQDHGGRFIPLQIQNDADAFAVRLVPEIRDPADFFLLDQFGYFFDQVCLVHLIGKLGDDDALPVVAGIFLDQSACPHPDDSASGAVGGKDAFPAVDEPGGGEVRTRDVPDQVVDADLRFPDQRDGPIDHLAQVVRRNVRRHTHGNSRRAVQQKQRDLRRKHGGLFHGFVVVGNEIDGVFFEIGQQLLRNPGHPDLRVPHRGRRVSVDRAEIPLAVDEQVAHRKVLRHSNDRVIGRLVSMGVVLADDVPDDPGRFFVGLVPAVAHLVHGKKDAAVDRLETIPDVGNGPADDDAHRIVHVGLLHLVFDVDRNILLEQIFHQNPFLLSGFAKRDSSLSGKDASGRSPVSFSPLDVQVGGVQRVFVDEIASRLHLVSHQGGENFVRLHRVLDPDLQEGPLLRVHRRFPELLRVHLAETLVALDGITLFTGADHVIDQFCHRADRLRFPRRCVLRLFD